MSNQYADEEVNSNYGYLSGYQPKSVTEQIIHLHGLFPALSAPDEGLLSKLTLPAGAEGFFAIPRWEKIVPTYGETVGKVFALIAESRRFYNYREGQLGQQNLRQHARTVKMFQVLGDQQPGVDILIVPAQFGLRHRGRSIRRAREVFQATEFGLGAFAVGTMLLTHPERLQHYNDLWIDCAGDEFSLEADGQFDGAPFFGFCGGRVGFDTSDVGSAYDVYGAASGLLPQ